MARQTLLQAVSAAYDDNEDPCGSAQALNGLPVGIYVETSLGINQLRRDLPAHPFRSFTIQQFIQAVYTVDRNNSYRTRPRIAAIRKAAEIEATDQRREQMTQQMTTEEKADDASIMSQEYQLLRLAEDIGRLAAAAGLPDNMDGYARILAAAEIAIRSTGRMNDWKEEEREEMDALREDYVNKVLREVGAYLLQKPAYTPV